MADRQLGGPLVSVHIPCYHNLAQARRCVASILAQSLTDFQVTLLDDGASDEYRDYAAALGDPRVRYQRNPVRLGAMLNMFAAIGAGAAPYSFAFHEDDLLGRHYLETAVGIMERDPSIGFVTADLHEFRSEPSPEEMQAPADPLAFDRFASAADFLRGMLAGREPMFGAVVYRRAALDRAVAAHDLYGPLVDRPFLLSILGAWAGAIVRDPLVWYRHHADTARHEGMTAEHIVRLFTLYRSTLPAPMSPRDRALFYTYSGHWLFTLYDLTPADQRPPFISFLFRVWRSGLYEARWRGRFGLRLLKRALLAAGRPAS